MSVREAIPAKPWPARHAWPLAVACLALCACSVLAEPLAGFQIGERFRDCAECPEMIVVPAGSYSRGAPLDQLGSDRERPVYTVTIPQPFAVGVYEVTLAEYDACVAVAGSCCVRRPDDQGWGRGQRPVIDVNWAEARSYVEWLSEHTGESYRLLSEAEWEYAARAGTTTPFHTGATISTDEANYHGLHTFGDGRKGVFRGRTLPVGLFDANAFGLHDMHGNVWEWVQDCWHDSYAGAPRDGTAWRWAKGNDDECPVRVLRGGTWNGEPLLMRSAYRGLAQCDVRSNLAGFRVARTIAP